MFNFFSLYVIPHFVLHWKQPLLGGETLAIWVLTSKYPLFYPQNSFKYLTIENVVFLMIRCFPCMRCSLRGREWHFCDFWYQNGAAGEGWVVLNCKRLGIFFTYLGKNWKDKMFNFKFLKSGWRYQHQNCTSCLPL